MSELVSMSLEDVHGLTTRILLGHGVSKEQTRAIANTVTNAERDDCKSHGLFRVPGYVKSVVSGKVTIDAVPTVRDLAPGVIQVDGMAGFSPLALEVGRAPLIERARSQGIAALAVINAHHFAALWPEVEPIAEQGLAAFACVDSFSYVAPAGGSKPLYGTNPIAFAWPRENHPPLVFDQATSASARGEIQIHLRDGKPIPEGWAIGPDGQPTTDPETALAGAQLPFGGYKGAALCLMVELLAGALVGDVFSFEATARDNKDGGPPQGGELIIAIDPSRCVTGDKRSGQFARAEALFALILEQDGTRLPSDRRYQARLTTPTEGISIPKSLHDTLLELENPQAE
ncbi:MAG: Ldh family oxidoreductase [Gammaproteobacteria bacterium]|jgi:delta1-piperideine-2-carboxylate reductase|nr:Ldh family oxidoreductase [Gammaproteobacteria bacterium]MDX2461441.1 Ldh family oxidoreductase [Gammaproteobacteria bacterium]